jgi:hypothetical protein
VPTTSDPTSTAFHTHPETGRTNSDYQAPAELASVPPLSSTLHTTPAARNERPITVQAQIWTTSNEGSGQCSLERR